MESVASCVRRVVQNVKAVCALIRRIRYLKVGRILQPKDECPGSALG